MPYNELKDKVPPHNLEAEQATLGALLLNWDAVSNVISLLDSQKFYSYQNRLIYEAMISLFRQNIHGDTLALINELTKEEKNRNESLENFQRIIDTDIPKIQESLKDEQMEMNENDNALSTRITEETQRMVDLVMNEKKAREETEEALLEMLKAMINAMKTQLENEKTERQNTQDYLINLLEDMCTKITQANDII